MRLPDGSVVLSYFGISETSSPEDMGQHNDAFLHQGEVLDIIYPDDSRSKTKRFVEYRVEVEYVDHATETIVTRQLPNCTQFNQLAGLADRTRAILRTANGDGRGSRVLVLCVNGFVTDGIILGGVRDEADNDDKTAKDLGLNFQWRFNGINFEVDKEGQATCTFGGPTTADGKLDESQVKKEVVGTTVQMLKDGSVLVMSPTGQSIHIDQTNKLINIIGKEKVQIQTEGDVEVAAQGAVSVTAGKGISMDGGSPGSNGAVIGLGEASDFMMKGTTFRANQIALHTAMQTAFQVIATAFQTAGATAALAVDIGTTIAGVKAVGVAITAAGAQLAALGGALGTFEGQAAAYLSTKNKLD